MKTSVSDLREHLFLQLERLKDDANGEELTDEALQMLIAMRGMEGQASRRKVAASILRKAAKALEVEA